MKTPKGNKGAETPKVKAKALPISQLVVVSVYEKHYSTGKNGFFGKVMDPQTGKRYQITAAVELAPKS